MRTLVITLLTLATFIRAELPDEEALLKQGGPKAGILIIKARRILANAEVLASCHVGDAGSPTANCWALTVIVRYDPDAKKFLNQVFEWVKEPVPRLYAIAGLVSLDRAEAARFAPDRIAKFSEEVVSTKDGCIGSQSTFGSNAAHIIESNARRYLFDKLPSLDRTQELTVPGSVNQ